MSTEEETKAPEEPKAEEEAGDDAPHEAEENTAHFEPVVSHDFSTTVFGSPTTTGNGFFIMSHVIFEFRTNRFNWKKSK